jgi:two-component system sensor histidine kinase KdpD
MVLTEQEGELNIRASEPPADTMDEGSWAAARWSFVRQEPAGRGTGTLPSSVWRFLPMKTARGVLGVLGVRSEVALDQPMVQALGALADQAAVAVERVRLAAGVARSAAQQETQKLRTALLNSLSHDLRTPLTGIRGAADTLRTAWDSLPAATRADLLKSIEEDTARMTRFLANITDLTRLESGAIAPRLAAVAPADAIEAAIARVPGAAHATVQAAPGLPRMLADPALLEQALVNVLENAVKYSSPGSPITIAATGEADAVAITIADEGTGITPDDLPHVFDSFYRAQQGDRVTPGTGLGLAIARGMIDAMGGTIEATSPRQDGKSGTVVTLRLPVAR